MDQKQRNILDEYLTKKKPGFICIFFFEEWSQFKAERLNHFFISIVEEEYAKPYETRKNTYHKMF